MNKAKGLIMVLTWLLPVALASAGTDYSGTWEVDPQRSQLAAWARSFDRTTITIEHREPNFSFRRVSFKAGKTDEASYELTTDGAKKVEQEGANSRTSWLSWDGDVLVFNSIMVLADGRKVTDTVRYTLRDGGQTLVAEEKFRGPVLKYDNLWVAARASRVN